MRRFFLISIGLFSAVFYMRAQTHINFNALDTIEAKVDSDSKPYYEHTLLQGETLYSLAKLFRTSYSDLLILNSINEDDILSVGTQIKLPLAAEHMITEARIKNKLGIPVVYKVKKQETLFKISHVYFDQKIEHLVARNTIRKLSLQTGEELTVGWWPLQEQTPKEIIKKAETLESSIPHLVPEYEALIDNDFTMGIPEAVRIPEDSELVDSISSKEMPEIISSRGIALWEREDTNTESLLVLHKSAKPGSVIKFQNPVTDRIVVAQVVGAIPENVYAEDIDAIISRAVALRLGALDTRFQVTMTYYE